MEKKHYRLLILGSGPAGCTAAIYAARANLDFAMITGEEQGGQLTKTPKIANWPGESEEISGATLMEKLLKQVHNFNATVLFDQIETADLTKKPFSLKSPETEYTCDALIIATGTSTRFLGIPSEKKYLGKGISTCAICDGFFYKNKEVVVAGGGNTAAEEAIYLAKIAKQVTLIHRRDTFRAEALLISQLKKTPNIKLVLNCNIIEILGDSQQIMGISIKNINTNSIQNIACQGVFLAIGRKPNSELFAGQLALDKNYIKTGFNVSAATSIEGVFAAGDVTVTDHRQAIIAAGSGCAAALDAQNFLNKLATAF